MAEIEVSAAAVEVAVVVMVVLAAAAAAAAATTIAVEAAAPITAVESDNSRCIVKRESHRGMWLFTMVNRKTRGRL